MKSIEISCITRSTRESPLNAEEIICGTYIQRHLNISLSPQETIRNIILKFPTKEYILARTVHTSTLL